MSLRFYCLLATVADTGRRVGEVLGLPWRALHLDATPPHFELARTKNGRQNYVPLTKRLVAECYTASNVAKLKAERNARWTKDPTVYVFPMQYQSVERQLTRLCERVDLEYKGFHCFRHTKATEPLARGVPIQAVASLLGHANAVGARALAE